MDRLHVWETLELSLQAEEQYTNPYKDVELWVRLTGPQDFDRRVWGFWDGDRSFKVRLTGIHPGTWRSVGGRGDPAKASEAEQDYRAWLLLRRTGGSAWPNC